ncbi:PQQ-dependent sugar dehydrogenase [Marinobacter sp. F4216]|uniref:PQQ-dependent sugar dehydrogenase n=1 Tax=Marinobacter sp. F4216 TaxID=2874281 RepID=UPI001CBCDA8D|nr:PQQ-dependent sugar dehydrogenase [Marinobacter sp. F4216]MBZ2167361.1 PQQ-dependent sugar dehydrogenase [Marinobacter sp. F4216]
MPVLKHILILGTLILGTGELTLAQTFSSQRAEFKLEEVASGLSNPWSLAFLPDGSMLVTERAGRLRIIRNGELDPIPIEGTPELVASAEGGLLDLLLHPDFADNQTLFLSYAHQNSEGMTTRVVRSRFVDGHLQDTGVIFEALPRYSSSNHFAGRLVMDAEGFIYVSVGDRLERDQAQDTADDAGGVHRITQDGEPAPGNPGLGNNAINDTLFTWGQRNPQGMTVHPSTGEVWTHEHGPQGGDELNILRGGTNYGWPEISYGIADSGELITPYTHREGMAQPLYYWNPSIAPSGMAFYTGTLFPGWRGDLFIGALKMRRLVRLRILNGVVIEAEDLLTDLGQRIRDVRMGPEGALWILTDSKKGMVYRLAPTYE